MKCGKCGSEVKERMKFCGKCGNAMYPYYQKFCKECGSELKFGAKYCAKCGSQSDNMSSNPQEVNNQSAFAKQNIDTNSQSDTQTNASQILGTQTIKPGMSKNALIAIIVSAAALVTFMVFGVIVAAAVSNKTPNENANGQVGRTATGPKIAVLDVTNMGFSEAVDTLSNAGFTNVVSDVDSPAENERWVVVGQSVAAGKEISAGDKIVLSCVKKCYLFLDISSDYNLAFNKYTITISLDGTTLGSVVNGGEFTYLADVDCGEHKIEFVKSDSSSPKQSKTIVLDEDTTYSCKLAHSGFSIDINNEHIENNLNSAFPEVIDVTDMPCSDAKKKLKDAGFINVTTNPSDISVESSWIVTSQSVEPGTCIDKNDSIQLECISSDDYFADYIGKNANECEKMAEGTWYTVVYKKDAFTTYDLSLLSEKGKEDYIVSSLSFSGYSKELQLYLTYIGPTPVPTATPTPRPTSTPVPRSTYDESSEKEYESLSEFAEALDAQLNASFSETDVEYYIDVDDEEETIIVYFIQPGACAVSVGATEGDDECISEWEDLADAFQDYSSTLYSQVMLLVDVDSPMVGVVLLNDLNTDNVLLAYSNGIKAYDVTDD